jgi:hypothetical protein
MKKFFFCGPGMADIKKLHRFTPYPFINSRNVCLHISIEHLVNYSTSIFKHL